MSLPSPTSPRPVRLLDKQTINQIAAGEVVESPAAALKELVENSIDAGSTRVDIEMVESGRKLIRVRDNGWGMSEGDLIRALERHATSKITSIEDLHQTVSLGFRGEAIPSIASVSRMTIETGQGDGSRKLIEVSEGKILDEKHVAGPQGTTVSVEDLFFNTPARLRFLKTDATEMRNALEVAQRLAVAYPNVAISFKHGPTQLFQTSGDGNILSAIAAVWGADVARAVVPVDEYDGIVRVRGFVSPPEFTKASRAYQWFFVNGRPIRSRSLGTSIDVAYRQLTPERRYPVVVLALEVDPVKVDCNVSPTKTEVKFQHDGAIFDGVRHAVKNALLREGMVPSASGIAAANAALAEHRVPMYAPAPEHEAPRFDFAHEPQVTDAFVALAFAQQSQPSPEEPTRMTANDLLDGLRVIGQSMSMFVIAENRKGLLIIDQHVAHERILFEMLCRVRGSGHIETQSLLVPVTLHLNPQQTVVFAQRLAEVEELGFAVEAFGTGSFLIRKIPAALKGQDPAELLKSLADEMLDGGRDRLTPTRELLWITVSCKMAIKAGEPMSMPEMEKLILDLAQTENPYLCPHGRPITIVLSKDDLLRKFKR